jgi:hypothetical protein
MKKVIVTVTALALAGVLNFGLASAHPFVTPTQPPVVQTDKPGDHQSGEKDESKANATTGKQDENDQMGEQDADVEEQGDHDANTTAGTETKDGQNGVEQDGEFDGDK